MADEIALGYLGSPGDPCWFFYRSNGCHSGNNDSLKEAFIRFLIEAQSLRKGYYGSREKDMKLVAGKSLIKWS